MLATKRTAGKDVPVKQKQQSEFTENLRDTLASNGTLFTLFAIALIVISGVTLVDNPSNWWVSVASVLAFALVVFLFTNARVVIKVVLVTALNVFLASYAFQFGSIMDPQGVGGLVWMAATMFTFFALISLSYLVPSGTSRWGAIGLATVLGFCTTYACSTVAVPVALAALLGALVAGTTFLLRYRLNRRTMVQFGKMPPNVLTGMVAEGLAEGAHMAGWESTILQGEGETGSVLIWRDRAYLFHPVRMDSPLGVLGFRGEKLGYQGKNINPWLIHLALREAPLWRARGAQVSVVLLDLTGLATGVSQPMKVIGASLPDTQKRLPIGLVRAVGLKGRSSASLAEAAEDLISMVDDEMAPFVGTVTDRQYLALSRIGVTEESPEETSEKPQPDKDASVDQTDTTGETKHD